MHQERGQITKRFVSLLVGSIIEILSKRQPENRLIIYGLPIGLAELTRAGLDRFPLLARHPCRYRSVIININQLKLEMETAR